MTLEELQAALPSRYRVIREIGKGGMATVYLAEDIPHGRNVAVKVLSPELGSSIDGERFKREIQIAARLSHPNILPAYDSGSANGIHFYVMPFIEGESVRARMDRESQLSIEEAIAITCEVCDALTYAHAQGIVHRDIKPENILLQSGHAVVADFGIARLVQEGGEKLTQTGMAIGTAQYMSPEQFSGEKVDGRSDLYAIACVLYEMLVGEPPFNGPNAMAIMARATMQPVPSIRLVRSSVPESVEFAVMHAMEKVPADRFAAVEEFKEALIGGAGSPALARQTRAYTAAYRAANPTRAWQSRRTMGFAALGAIVLVLASAGAWMAFGARRSPPPTLDAESKRVGVLYFEDKSTDGSLRYIADGLTESLIDELDRVGPALDVMSRNAVRPFRGTEFKADSVYRALKAGLIVRGEIAPGGKGAQVTVRLVEGVSGNEGDKFRFDFDTSNAIASRAELAQRVADLLRKTIGEGVQLKESKLAASNPQAWTLVQRAEKRVKDVDSLLSVKQDAQALPILASADAELAAAASLDKQWAQPWITRGLVAFQRARLDRDRPAVANAALDTAKSYADTAIARDPRSADALELRGRIAFAHVQFRTVPLGAEWDGYLEQAEKDLLAAVSLNRSQASAFATLSRVAYARKHVPEGLQYAVRAYDADAYLLNADTIVGRLFWGYFDTENFPEASRWCDEGHRRFPRDIRFVQCRLYLMTAKGVNPDPAEAWRLADTIRALAPKSDLAYEDHMARTLVGGVLGRAGDRDSANRVLVAARADKQIDKEQEIIGREIMMRLIYGDHEGAITRLADYLLVHPDHRSGLANQTAWYWRDPKVQNDPRFKSLIAGAR